MVPVGGPQDLAGEGVEPGDARVGFGIDEGADGAEHEPGGDLVAGLGAQPPASGVVIPALGGHAHPEAEVRVQAVLAGDAAVVGLDLCAGREHPGPVGVLGERVLVGEAGHVHPDARVVVVPPAAGRLGRPLQDDEIVDAGVEQPDTRADAGRSGADHGHGVLRFHGRSFWFGCYRFPAVCAGGACAGSSRSRPPRPNQNTGRSRAASGRSANRMPGIRRR
ncbi:hypothetical protein C1Y40_00605 [Mycobacterium talmoniae]|uniref:Uncharacterized protein n=1 Tax=Mycobacterium talmoniae TaxID=1858794 RepID=A0A2S8BRC4_9MYCO|nr:hypothetical protein C1Y40_00605 [Mycobacterium talmoniae]